jgi:hypothetical protein
VFCGTLGDVAQYRRADSPHDAFDCGNGLNLQTRVDDDDAVSRDFVADLQVLQSSKGSRDGLFNRTGCCSTMVAGIK